MLNDVTNLFKYIFTGLFYSAEQVYKNVHRFSKHMGDPGINSGLPNLANIFDKLSENILFVRMVTYACVCHGPVPVVKKSCLSG